ncbi:MAG: hypothetical protein II330_08425 [Clostridia bacterium]|nr:hypothetical protein [Clostridia bacterium]
MAETNEKTTVKGKYLEYKDKPLVREGNTICYGDMSDKYVLLLEIMSYKKVGDEEVPDTIFIQIISTDGTQQIYKQGQKTGLYDAFDIGLVWLERALKQ